MNYLLEHNLYSQAILSSRQILDLLTWMTGTSTPRPTSTTYAWCLFPRIGAVSPDREHKPAYILSVIRQESLFEPRPLLRPGTRVMQIVPATGEEIATQLNWPPEYKDDDLERATIAIPLGARYLARQKDLFNGDLFAVLAAYNGGPGNALAWNDLAKDDQDLFLEVIRAEETRTYIMQIFEFYNIYRLIYEQRPEEQKRVTRNEGEVPHHRYLFLTYSHQIINLNGFSMNPANACMKRAARRRPSPGDRRRWWPSRIRFTGRPPRQAPFVEALTARMWSAG
jgi:hypothetical protein